MRVAGYADDSIVDGSGLRFTIFFQGCPHRCVGCHNPQTWDKDGGEDTSAAEILAKIDKNPLIDGVTFSGGEPMEQAAEILPLADAIKARGLNLVIYSGYAFEEIIGQSGKRTLLEKADLLVDGRFVLAERTLDLPFVGSRNQRVIDVKKSLAGNAVVLADIKN